MRVDGKYPTRCIKMELSKHKYSREMLHMTYHTFALNADAIVR